MKNYVKDKLGTQNIRKPLNAQIEITLRCNAKCVFCSIWTDEYKHSLKDLGKEMTTDEVKSIIDQLDKMDIQVLSFTGGEPTLRKDLPELLNYTVKKGMMPTMVTNGFLLERFIDNGTINSVNMEMLMVSIDRPERELHDEYRGIKVFDRAVRGIDKAIQAGIKVIISNVVTKETLSEMENMCKFAKLHNCMIELLPCENIVRELSNSNVEVQNIEEEFVPDINKWASEIRRLIPKYSNLTTDHVTTQFIQNGGFQNNKNNIWWFRNSKLPCYVATSYLFIRYNGEVLFPCKLHPIYNINILKYPIEKVYNTIEIQEVRRKLDTYDFCKGCRLGCAITNSETMVWWAVYEKYLKAFFKGNLF